jgi:hypothetical protein
MHSCPVDKRRPESAFGVSFGVSGSAAADHITPDNWFRGECKCPAAHFTEHLYLLACKHLLVKFIRE